MTNHATTTPTIQIGSTSISQDAEGRFSLNDLHRAAGGEERHRPNYFLEIKQTKELIDAIDEGNLTAGFPAVKTKEGRYGGSFAVKEIVYAYANWISPAFYLKMIRAFDAMVMQGAATPTNTPTKTAIQPTKEFKALFSVARLIGLDRNAAAISANIGTRKLTGVDTLALMDHVHLTNEQQELYFTPTELSARIDLSAVKFNKLLEKAGLQQRQGDKWEPTGEGLKYCRVMDTGKRHSDGTMVQQVKWSERVLDRVRPLLVSLVAVGSEEGK